MNPFKWKLYSDWKLILRKSWVVKAGVLSGLLSALEFITPFFVTWFPQGIFIFLAMIISFVIPIIRVVYQKDI